MRYDSPREKETPLAFIGAGFVLYGWFPLMLGGAWFVRAGADPTVAMAVGFSAWFLIAGMILRASLRRR